MSTSEDFIPQEADIEVIKNYFTEDVKNLASKDDLTSDELRDILISNTLLSVGDHDARYSSQRESWDDDKEGIWNLADAAFRSFLNDEAVQEEKSIGANEPETWERAKIGSTLFYRQVSQKASNGYAVQTSKDMPFRYEPLLDAGEIDTPDHAKMRAKKLNLLAKWSMKADRMNLTSMEFWTQIYKYGNIPVMMDWIQKIGKRKISRPVFNKDGDLERYESEEIETVTENRPSITLLPIESVKADATIGNIQDQECVIVQSLVGMSEIIGNITTGLYRKDLIEDLDRSKQWDGYTGFESNDEKADNRLLDDEPETSGSGKYLKREVFVNLPIDLEDGTWDEMKNIPQRYRVTLLGNSISSSAIARIERNQEPSDRIPIEMIHANPDDSNYLYHISPYEVIRSNMAVETTLFRQVIDNNSLVCKQPLWEVKNEVHGNDREFRPDQRYIVDSKDSIGEFNIRDVSQTTLPILQFVKEDSNTANSIDKNMSGESFGARTTASEANTIAGNSRRPNLVNIEYIMEQYFGFYAQWNKDYWEAYGRDDQVVQITDENDNLVFIKPDEIHGEYDIVIDIMDDIKDKAVEGQRMINYMKTVGSIPQLAQITDWEALHKVFSETVMGTAKFVQTPSDEDADENARRNIVMMIENSQFPRLAPNMNLKRHLELYKQERLRWSGNEEQNPNVEGILDRVIEQIEARISGDETGGNMVQAQATPNTEAIEEGNITGGVLGGF